MHTLTLKWKFFNLDMNPLPGAQQPAQEQSSRQTASKRA